jgi:SAM-dependent methyltransferase
MNAAPLADVDFGDKKFDLITCNHSLEHMRDPLSALRRLHDLLQPDGHLYVSVPNLGDPNIWPTRYFHAGHLYGFTHETLVMMGAKAGFAPPFGTETSLIFRRLAAPDPNWFSFPGYAAQAEIKWQRHTIWRYLFTPRNYRQIPGRIRYFLNDYLVLTRTWLRSVLNKGQSIDARAYIGRGTVARRSPILCLKTKSVAIMLQCMSLLMADSVAKRF